MPDSGSERAAAPPAVRRIAARTRAFEALFEAAFEHADAFAAYQRERGGDPLEPDERAYGAALVRGVVDHLAELDGIIAERADRLPISQMPLVYRTVLRIALYELLFNNEAGSERAPVRRNIVIKEAVALARRYGDDAGRRLASAVLGAVSRSRFPENAPPAEPDPQQRTEAETWPSSTK